MKILSAHVTPGRAGSHTMAVVVVVQHAEGVPAAFAVDPNTGSILAARFVRDIAEVGNVLAGLQIGGYPPIIEEQIPPPPRQPHGSDRIVLIAREIWKNYQDVTREAVTAAIPTG